jgi:hypothetical protein
VCLNDDPQHRVAKNPLQCVQLRPLIFHELESRSCRGHKVMISATPATVNFPAFAAGGPNSNEEIPRRALRGILYIYV